ncbi:MAG: flagellar hook-basal body complex protein FliE [Nocardioides sp.]|jgi:flagellar hook-basal body complex protein FliE
MSVSGIEAMGFTPYVAPQVPASGATGAGAAAGPSGVQGASFGDLVLDGLDRLEGVQDRSDQLAVQAATGDLQNLHDYTIAATEATVTTQMTVAVRNKAVEAFTEIMRMQV